MVVLELDLTTITPRRSSPRLPTVVFENKLISEDEVN